MSYAITVSKLSKIKLFVVLMAICTLASAADGLFGIDHVVSKDDSGIWSRNNQLLLQSVSAAVVLGGAAYEGNETRLGRTYWKAFDSMMFTAVGSTALKYTFQRKRPSDGGDPNAWFQGSGNTSFPSGEVAHITSIVTPFIAEYHEDNPAVWGLLALPLYDGVARLKSQAHWQSDVLAGMALGAAVGLYASGRENSWFASVLPGGFSVGYRYRF